MKHTKGPWVKDYGQTVGHIKTLCNPEVHTKTVIKYRYDLCEEILTEEEIEANARLISCAPEMLDMIINDYKFFVLWSENNTDESLKRRLEKKVSDKKELIEKATGSTIEEVLKNV